METIEEMISSAEHFIIKQKKEWMEILSGLETNNNYLIFDGDKNQIGVVSELGQGFMQWLKRMFLRSHRPFEISVSNNQGKELLKLHRPFFWFFSDLYVEYQGNKYGSIHRKFSFIYKTYHILDPQGQELFHIKSPIWRLWNFPIFNKREHQIGLITKKWQGMLKEMFSDADAFYIDLSHQELTTEQKVLLFVSGISVDFDFFEQNQGSNGILDLFSN